MKNKYEQAAEILEMAADGFESGRYGWTRGRAQRWELDGYSYCSVGALYYEAGLYNAQLQATSRHDATQAYVAAEQAMAEKLGLFHMVQPTGTSSSGIPVWNDHVVRGVEQVIDAMKDTAKELRNKA